MKPLIKILIIIGIIFGIGYGSFFFYKQGVKQNIEEREKSVSIAWKKLFAESSSRLSAIEAITADGNVPNIDSLKKYISINHKERKAYENQFDLKFAKLEYDVNRFLPPFSDSSVAKANNSNSQFIKLAPEKINSLVDNYNDEVHDFNSYRIRIPQSFILRKSRFKLKDFFRFKYGRTRPNSMITTK